MATITYSWSSVVAPFFLNDITTGNQNDPAIASLAGGGYFGAWSSPAQDFLKGRFVEHDGNPLTDEFQVNSTTLGDQFDASAAGLANGNAVVTFTNGVSGIPFIQARLFDADGDPIDIDFVVAFGSDPLSESDMTALANGGFAVSFTRETATGDLDPYVQRFTANGSPVGGPTLVENGNTQEFSGSASSIAGLAGGGFVVAFELVPDFPDDPDNPPQYAYYRVFKADGSPLDSSHQFDNVGSIDQDLQVAALADGGFAIAYTDNGWSEDGTTDITVRVFNGDGSVRSDFIRANRSSVIVGDQDKPSVTALSNGFFVVSWTNEANGVLYQQAFDANGNLVGGDYAVSGLTIEGEIAALSGGLVANVRSSELSDGSGNSIRSSVSELARTTTGDPTEETLTGDKLRDIIFGNGGSDTLNGGQGNDSISGGAGNDRITGGQNNDTLGGGNGNDTFIFLSGFGVDSADGGADVDTLDFRPAGSSGVVANLATGIATLGANTVDFNNIETLLGTVSADSLTGNAFANRLTGFGGNDTVLGGQDNDTITGGAGNDSLVGGLGNDTLTGGAGADTLNGNSGADIFDYNAVTETGITAATRDRIVSFAINADDIDLSSIDAIPGGANNAFVFRGTAAFTAVGQVRLAQSGADTVVQINTAGTTVAEATILLAAITATTLDSNEFIL